MRPKHYIAGIAATLTLALVTTSTFVRGQASDDEFARTTGADQYGTTYEVQEVPDEMNGVLDAQGKYVLPSFINATIYRGEDECWVIDQIPLPGTIIDGPQTVEVQLNYTCDGEDEYWARLPIEAIDITPPNVEVQLRGNGVEPLVAPSGLRYFQPPVTITTDVVAIDNVEGMAIAPDPKIDIYIDCEELVDAIELVEPGYYTLRTYVSDSAGNTTYYSELFEVRNNLNVEAAAAIEEFSVTPAGGTDFVDAVVHLTSGEVDPCVINLATFALWLYDGDGQPVGTTALRMSPGYVVDGTYDPAMVDLDLCVWQLAVHGEVPAGSLSNPGLQFIVTGSGLHGNPGEFDFVSRKQPFVAVADAQTVVLDEADPDCNCGDPPPPPPPPPCEWKSQFIQDDEDTINRSDSDSCGYENILLTATADSISGGAHAGDWCWDDGPHSESGSVASGGTFKVFLEPQDCCTDCEISIVARPKFKAKVDVSGGGTGSHSAVAGGLISVATPCGDTAAAGGVAVGDLGGSTVTITIGDVEVEVPVSQNDEAEQAFQGNLSCVHDGCSVDISIATGAYLDVQANDGFISIHTSRANASVFGSNVGLTVTPNADPSCNVINDGTPFTVDNCADVQTP